MEFKISVAAILSNGVFIDKRVISFFRKEKLDPEFYISLDGLKKSHEGFRGKKNIYDKVVCTIKYLIKEGFKVTISTSLNKYNVEESDKLFDLIKKLGVRRWRITSPFYSGNWIKNKDQWD